MGKSTSHEDSPGSSSSSGNSSSVNPKDLRFTQKDINGFFSKSHSGVSVSDVVADIKAGNLDPSSLGPLDVHRGSDGEIWCENNRRLWAFRQAEVPSVDVKYKNNDSRSRCLDDKTKDKLRDPNYLPKIRGSGV